MSGATLWFTGLPSAGKTTLATAVAEQLRAAGRPVELLDGDEVREFLSKGLGFSREDRETNVTRIGYVASLLAAHGVTVLASVISPYAASRDKVRALHGERGADFVEVYVATPVDVCSERDVKGLYAKQRAGELTGLTGVDDPYEAPTSPEITVATQDQTLDESVDQVLLVLTAKGLA
ncbi:MAG: adenylyl-sulfate kinase [Mycobacteriales bacterium]